MSKLRNLAAQDIDPEAITDLAALAGVDPFEIKAAIAGEKVAVEIVTTREETRIIEEYEPAHQWREGYTKAELVVILGRKTRTALENAVGFRARTKGAIMSALGDLTKEEVAEVLGFINPTPPKTETVTIEERETIYREPRFDGVNDNTQFVADLAATVQLEGTRKVRAGVTGSLDLGPFPDLEIALDAFEHWQSSDSYASRYRESMQLLRAHGSWYVHVVFWARQSDKKARGVKRGTKR